MTTADAARQVPWLRYALLGGLVAVIWLAISLFASAVGASADEEEPKGLLGVVGGTVGAAAETTAVVGDGLGEAVEIVVEPVNAVVEPVVEVVPEPVAPV